MQKRFNLIFGPFLALMLVLFVDLSPGKPVLTYTAAVTIWVAWWWLTEAVHLAVSSLVPFIFLPIAGVASPKIIAQQYTDSIIFLFLGGFLLSFAIEKWGLHKRMAYFIMSKVGFTPTRILAGIMLTTWLISGWISNTTTTLMLLGAVLAIIHEWETLTPSPNTSKASAALLLGLCYAASLGGMSTPVGTPPNLFFFRFFHENYPQNADLNFVSWTVKAMPISFVLTFFCFLTLWFLLIRNKNLPEIQASFFYDKRKQLGKMSYEEKWVTVVFSICAILWFSREPLLIGNWQFLGWKEFFHKESVDDASVAITFAMLLFFIPSTKKNEHILEWKDASGLRYDILLLFGSGFALAYAFEKSGLSHWLASHLALLKDLPSIFVIFGIVTMITVISEFASNIASIQLTLPVLAALAPVLNVDPLVIMFPATLAASVGFMLPVATAPNTIAFGTGKIPIKTMFLIGFILDLICIMVITLFSLFMEKL